MVGSLNACTMAGFRSAAPKVMKALRADSENNSAGMILPEHAACVFAPDDFPGQQGYAFFSI